VTERILIGTGICLVVERDPIVCAKEVASLDHLSGGRVLFGVGAGWNREEMENHGTDPASRFSLMRERIEAMKAIWTEDEAEYHGERVSFDPIWSWPKPVQQPHPPVLVGGNGKNVLDRVVAFGDEWMPNLGLTDLDEVGRRVQRRTPRQATGGEAGRDGGRRRGRDRRRRLRVGAPRARRGDRHARRDRDAHGPRARQQ